MNANISIHWSNTDNCDSDQLKLLIKIGFRAALNSIQNGQTEGNLLDFIGKVKYVGYWTLNIE